MKLTLNEAMDIGATYPSPSSTDESDKKKEYLWKCSYSSQGTDDCCSIQMNGKKYDYLFWEGQCSNKEVLKGEVVGISKEHFVDDLEILLERLGLNDREREDFIVYWMTKLSNRKCHKVTICDEVYDNEIAQLEVSGFSKIHRVMLKFEEVEELSNLKKVNDVERKARPTGKYVIEWGAILA